jgi:hypothetical protein
MPTLYRRAQAWVEAGKAEWVSNDLNIKAVRLCLNLLGMKLNSSVLALTQAKSSPVWLSNQASLPCSLLI